MYAVIPTGMYADIVLYEVLKNFDEYAHVHTSPNIGGKLIGYIFTVSTLKFALDSTLQSFQKISVMRWEIINVASTQMKLFSLDGARWNGRFKSKKHGKSLFG